MSSKIDINKADASKFEEVDGIDHETARRIIEFREEIGDFKRLADLDNVPGLDGNRLHNLKSQGFVQSARISYPLQCDCSSTGDTASEGADSHQESSAGVRPEKGACCEELIDSETIGELDSFFQTHGIRRDKRGPG